MKSFTMKALAVAVLGLAGMGTAMAACPPIGGASASPGGGGAWTSQTVTSSTFGNAGGLNGTTCGLGIATNTGAASNVKGFVTDSSPQNEMHYRARFYFSVAAMTNLSVANRQFRIFSALATSAPSTAGAGAEEVIVNLVGGAVPPATPTMAVRFLVGDTGSAGSYKIISVPLPTATTAGQYRVEFDLDSTAGTFRYWVSDAAAATSDASPTGTATVTQTGWSGVKQANLGLFGTSANFRTNVATQQLIVDEFDSRRQTFIGQ